MTTYYHTPLEEAGAILTQIDMHTKDDPIMVELIAAMWVSLNIVKNQHDAIKNMIVQGEAP